MRSSEPSQLWPGVWCPVAPARTDPRCPTRPDRATPQICGSSCCSYHCMILFLVRHTSWCTSHALKWRIFSTGLPLVGTRFWCRAGVIYTYPTVYFRYIYIYTYIIYIYSVYSFVRLQNNYTVKSPGLRSFSMRFFMT